LASRLRPSPIRGLASPYRTLRLPIRTTTCHPPRVRPIRTWSFPIRMNPEGN